MKSRNESSSSKFTSGSFLKVLMPKISKKDRRNQTKSENASPRNLNLKPNRPAGEHFSR